MTGPVGDNGAGGLRLAGRGVWTWQAEPLGFGLNKWPRPDQNKGNSTTEQVEIWGREQAGKEM